MPPVCRRDACVRPAPRRGLPIPRAWKTCALASPGLPGAASTTASAYPKGGLPETFLRSPGHHLISADQQRRSLVDINSRYQWVPPHELAVGQLRRHAPSHHGTGTAGPAFPQHVVAHVPFMRGDDREMIFTASGEEIYRTADV